MHFSKQILVGCYFIELFLLDIYKKIYHYIVKIKDPLITFTFLICLLWNAKNMQIKKYSIKHSLNLTQMTRYSQRKVWRSQRCNQKPQIEKLQTTQWPSEKGQKDKQRGRVGVSVGVFFVFLFFFLFFRCCFCFCFLLLLFLLFFCCCVCCCFLLLLLLLFFAVAFVVVFCCCFCYSDVLITDDQFLCLYLL